jgi:hypothetical protein
MECSGEADVTKEQVNQLFSTFAKNCMRTSDQRERGLLRFNLDNLCFDTASVETVLLSGLRSAGTRIVEEHLQPTGDLEPS